jgi:hypothetical protein
LDAAFSSSCHSSRECAYWGSKMKNVSEYIDNKCKELYVPGRNVTRWELSRFQRKDSIQVLQSEEAYKMGPTDFLSGWFSQWLCVFSHSLLWQDNNRKSYSS